MPDAGSGVEAVVSTDPVILVWTRLGQRVAQVFDDQGRPGPRIGLRLSTDGGALVAVGEHEGVLVVQHAYGEDYAPAVDPSAEGAATYAYDEATGEERWHLEPEAGRAVGLVDGRVVLARVVGVRREGELQPTQEVWLTDREVSASAAAGELRSLGSVSTGSDPVAVLGIVGADLLVAQGDRVLAVPVPADGEDRVYDAPPAPGEPEAVDESAWTDDDVRPGDAAGACRSVQEDTLAALGFQSLDLPAPVDCRWEELRQPNYLSRSLTVSVEVVPPGPSPTGEDLSAVEAAQVLAEATVGRIAEEESASDGESTGWAADAGVEGTLGDVTWSAISSAPQASGAVVRWHNVVIRVDAEQVVSLGDRRSEGVPASALSQGVHDAVADVLAALGADPAPSTPVVEPYQEVPDVCAVLAKQVSALVGGPAEDESPRISDPAPESFCSWDRSDVTASVQLLAADPLDGASASEVAGELFDLSGGGRAVTGLGDRAVVQADNPDDYGPSGSVVVQSGNALVKVGFFEIEGLDSKAAAIERLTAMARRLVEALD